MAKLSQVMRNLLSNAMKFTPKNSTVTVCLKVILKDKNDTQKTNEKNYDIYCKIGILTISVIDQGVGISKVNYFYFVFFMLIHFRKTICYTNKPDAFS